MRYAANCSLLFTELPLLERPRAAREAGFAGVEFAWPFDRAVPPPAEVEAFVEAVRAAGVQLVALNFFSGDLAAGDRGLVSLPGRSEEFRANAEVLGGIGSALGCRRFHAAYGNRVDGADPAAQDALAVANLAHAAGLVGAFGGTVLVEPMSGLPRFPLRVAADAVAVLDAVAATGVTNVALLADLYHLAVNGDDVDAVIAALAPRIGHVQVADAPGRGEPGSGTLPLGRWLDALAAHGYDGWVALEYLPTRPTADTFDALPVLPAS